MDLARIHGGESISCCIGPANSVANIAHRVYVLSGVRIDDGLARFAGQWPGAAGRHERHVAGVEICPKGWNNRRAASIRCFRWVDVEGAVFLDDPAIVGDWGYFVFAVHNMHHKIARLREN